MSRGMRFASMDVLPPALRGRVPAPLAPSKPRAKPRKDEEHVEQVVFFNRISSLALNDKAFALAVRSTHAIPNGGGRTKAEAGRLKAEGVKKGVSDIFVRLPVPGYHGLYIEMKKRQGGRVSTDQAIWIDESKMLGYRAHVCQGADEAFDVWRNYVRRALQAMK